MKFLADENISRATINILVLNGYEVLIIDEELRGSDDSKLMEIAARNAMIILTYDKDFGELIFKDLKKHPSGVILFRLTNDYPEYAGELLLNIINEDKLILENHFTVIDDTKIRQRKFI